MSLQQLYKFQQELPVTEKMPLLFLGHGSPMNAIEDNEFTRGFKHQSTQLPKPAAILCISAHWLTYGTSVTAMEQPKTIHDFGGFPKELYEIEYKAPGSPALAKLTQETITDKQVMLDQEWGLDHGAWTVIKHLYPAADVPIIQMSLDLRASASSHFKLAKELSSLRKRGVLIIGSGNIIHNLRMVDFANFHRDNYGYDWAIEAKANFNELLLKRDFNSLMHYEKLGTAAKLAIPTPDHYWPLLYPLGLMEEQEELTFFNDKLLAGSLSMTSLRIG